jgi:hypothetical protein
MAITMTLWLSSAIKKNVFWEKNFGGGLKKQPNKKLVL